MSSLPDNRRRKKGCNKRIQELAQHLELWLDQELFGDDQELTKIKFFVTDGFFKAEPDLTSSPRRVISKTEAWEQVALSLFQYKPMT
jgi:hypothetical protein